MATRRLWLFVGTAVAGTLVGVIYVSRAMIRARSEFLTDGERIRELATSAPRRRVLWTPAEAVPGGTNGAVDEYEPRISADGSVMVLVRGRPGANADLFVRRRTNGGWSAEEAIAEVNTNADELGPELSSDGLSLYFYSDRPGGLGGYDLWVSRRDGDSWGPPVNLGPGVNTEFNEYGPALTPDGKELFFASNRPRADEPEQHRDVWTATVRERRGRHDYDLYIAKLEEGVARSATALAVLNTPGDEGAPAMSPVGDFLYFASDRAGGIGGFDLYRARRLHGTLGPPENLGAAINSRFDDLDPGLSTDGFRLYFSSNRGLHAIPPEATSPTRGTPAEPYALWASSSREVFEEYDDRDARRAFVARWGELWPWLAVILLAGLLAGLLWWILRGLNWRERYRRLSLLAKCVVVSLAVHALLASAFAAWRVGSSVGEFLRRGGGTRVVLASSGALGGVSGQVRAVSMPALTRPQLPTVARTSTVETPVLEVPRFDTTLPDRLRVEDSSRAQPLNLDSELTSARPDLRGISSAATQNRPEILPVGDADSAITTPRDAGPAQAVTTAESLRKLPVEIPSPARARMTETAPTAAAPRVDISPSTAGLSAKDVLVSDHAVIDQSVAISEMGETGRSSTRPWPAAMNSGPALPTAPSEDSTTTAIALPQDSGPAHAEAQETRAGTSGSSMNPIAPIPAVPRAAVGIGVEPAKVRADRVELAAPGIAWLKSDVARDTGAVGSMDVSWARPATATKPASSPHAPGVLLSAESTADKVTDPRLPVLEAETPPVETFAQRAPEVREELLERMGGSERTERAVGLALEWFRAHQSADGRWSGRGFDDGCGACDGRAEIDADAAMTGVVLLCYLGAGHTHTADGPYREQVKRGIGWLLARQASNGDMRAGETMYGHTIATVAMCEAFAMTRDATLESPTKRAAEFLFQGTTKGRGRDATSVLGWEVMAMESARRAGIRTPRTTFDSARKFLDSVCVPTERGKYAYRRGEAPSAAMTAEAMFVQQLLGLTRDQPRMRESADFILLTPPRWKDGAPTYYWYYATMALFQQQGEAWDAWNSALVPELLGNQRTDGPASGSWDPQDEWSKLGGRVYQTAVCTLSLEVYYRYGAKGVELSNKRPNSEVGGGTGVVSGSVAPMPPTVER